MEEHAIDDTPSVSSAAVVGGEGFQDNSSQNELEGSGDGCQIHNPDDSSHCQLQSSDNNVGRGDSSDDELQSSDPQGEHGDPPHAQPQTSEDDSSQQGEIQVESQQDDSSHCQLQSSDNNVGHGDSSDDELQSSDPQGEQGDPPHAQQHTSEDDSSQQGEIQVESQQDVIENVASPDENELPPPHLTEIVPQTPADSVPQGKTLLGMPLNILLLAVIGGIAIGFILGFSGGLANMDTFMIRLSRHAFIAKKKTKRHDLCSYTNSWILLFVTLVPLSAMVSIGAAFVFISFWGRKRLLLAFASICCIVGSSLCTWFPSASVEACGMIFLGVGLGITYQIIPMFYLQTVVKEYHGQIDMIFQHMIQVGNFLACITNFLASLHPKQGWTITFGTSIFLSVLLLLVTWKIEEQTGEQVLANKDNVGNRVKKQFRDLKNRPKLVISVVAQLLLPFVGIGTLIFFAPILLGSLGYESSVSFRVSIIANAIGIITSGLYIYFVDRGVGRRIPIILSFIVILISQVSIWSIFHFGDLNINFHLKKKAYASWFASLMILSVIGFSIASAPHGWTKDEYDWKSLSLGLAFELSTFMLMKVVMSQIIIRLFCQFSTGVFIFIAVAALIFCCLTFVLVPETSDIPHDDILTKVWGAHLFWRRFYGNRRHIIVV